MHSFLFLRRNSAILALACLLVGSMANAQAVQGGNAAAHQHLLDERPPPAHRVDKLAHELHLRRAQDDDQRRAHHAYGGRPATRTRRTVVAQDSI